MEVTRDFLINISAGLVCAVLFNTQNDELDVFNAITLSIELIFAAVFYMLSVLLNQKIYDSLRNMDEV